MTLLKYNVGDASKHLCFLGTLFERNRVEGGDESISITPGKPIYKAIYSRGYNPGAHL